jgi:hypothetical protein
MWHEWGRRGTCIVGKPEGKRPIGRPRYKWVYNIKMDLIEMEFGCGGMNCSALVNAVMNLRVPQNAGKLPSGCTTCDLSSSAQLHTVS